MTQEERVTAPSPADEIVQVVDRENRQVGAVARKVMREKKLPHRASYIFVFHPDGRLFVQKRTETKDVFPGYLDVAAGGVMLEGETHFESASRELEEELGISDIPLEFLFEHYYEDAENKVWGYIYRCTHPGPFTLQAEEIDEGYFMAIKDILTGTAETPFTPDGIEILKKIEQLQYSST